jgi:hypothetical protein
MKRILNCLAIGLSGVKFVRHSPAATIDPFDSLLKQANLVRARHAVPETERQMMKVERETTSRVAERDSVFSAKSDAEQSCFGF